MKNVLLAIAMILISNPASLAQDSLSSGEKQLLILLGTVFSEAKHQIIAENRTNGDKGILGTALKETMRGMALKTKDQILGSGQPQTLLNLPALLNQNKDILIQHGKGKLLQNFKSSMETAAWNALNNSLFSMVDELTEIDPKSLVQIATAQSVSITDIFYNANKSKLIKVVKPAAITAFKLSGGKKLYKKIEKTIKRSGTSPLNIDNPEYLAEAATEYFFSSLKAQENGIRKNPLKALDNLLDILFKKDKN